MALAPLSQTLVLTADGSNFPLTDAVAIPIGAIAPPPTFTVAPSISPSSGTTATIFTANDGTVENGSVTGRRWLLSGSLIGTDTTVRAPNSGSLVLEVAALGTGGVITVKSAAVVVAALPAPAFSGNPTISPSGGTTGATYTATDPTVSNGTITLRQWLLGATVLGTGTTIVPGPGNTGSLTRKVYAQGTDGSTITIISEAVTVSAIPAPTFSGKPAISPASGDTAATFSATDPTIANGSITGRAWLLGTAIIGVGATIVPGAGNSGSLTRRVTGQGIDGSTISIASDPVVVSVPKPTLDNTYANSTAVYANNPAFAPSLLAVQQRLAAMDASMAANDIDFGSAPNTPTGDTVYVALSKLQNRATLIEAGQNPAPVKITISGTPPAATQNVAYQFAPTTANGSGSKSFAISGALPAGLTFNTATGSITGTPTAAGTASGLDISVTDGTGTANLGAFSIVVAASSSSTGIPPNGVWNDSWTWDDTQTWKDAA